MTKPQAKKLIIPISVGLTIILIGIISILLIGSTKPKPNDTPSVLPAADSSEPASSETVVSVPDIKVVATPSKAPSSEPVSEITVDGSPSSQVMSSKPESKPAVSSKPTEQTQTKPTSSQPPKVESKEPSKDPNNPSNGTIKIEKNEFGDEREMEFWNGQWWDNGPANQQWVDDSDRVLGPCSDCGFVDCICRIGY